MRSLAEVNDFVGRQLAMQVGNTLQGLAQLPGAREWFPPGGWFREGTVQAYLAAAIESYIREGTGAVNWIVFQEQPYEELPDRRADLWVVEPGRRESVLIEVKANFVLDSAKDDYSKVAIAQPRSFDYGYVFFCARSNDAERWKREIEKGYNPEKIKVYARAIDAGSVTDAGAASDDTSESAEPDPVGGTVIGGV